MSKDIKDLYERGIKLYNDGKYEPARELLEEVILFHPRYADVYNRLGVIANLQGRLDDAVLYFERAVELNPAYSEASMNLSITLNEMGQTDRAHEVFLKACEAGNLEQNDIDPFLAGKLANEHFKLGNIYLDLNMHDEAIDEYRRALDLRPGLVDIRTKMALALRAKGLYDQATTELTRAKSDNPYFGPARVQLGLTYYMDGLVGMAFEEWEDALKVLPNLKEAESFLSVLREKHSGEEK